MKHSKIKVERNLLNTIGIATNYDVPKAICELVDNSMSFGSVDVELTNDFFRITDRGALSGMSEMDIKTKFMVASGISCEKNNEKNISIYGLGGKTAMSYLGHELGGDVVEIMTKKTGFRGIGMTLDLKNLEYDWDYVDDIPIGTTIKMNHASIKNLDAMCNRVRDFMAVTYSKRISSGSLLLVFNGEQVDAQDPMYRDVRGMSKHLKTNSFDYKGETIKITCLQLNQNSIPADKVHSFDLNVGKKKSIMSPYISGFYISVADRMIAHGNNFATLTGRKTNTEQGGIRFLIEIPKSLYTTFGGTYNKGSELKGFKNVPCMVESGALEWINKIFNEFYDAKKEYQHSHNQVVSLSNLLAKITPSTSPVTFSVVYEKKTNPRFIRFDKNKLHVTFNNVENDHLIYGNHKGIAVAAMSTIIWLVESGRVDEVQDYLSAIEPVYGAAKTKTNYSIAV